MSKLNIKKEKIDSIWEYLSIHNIKNIYELLHANNIESADIHKIRKSVYVKINDKKSQSINKEILSNT